MPLFLEKEEEARLDAPECFEAFDDVFDWTELPVPFFLLLLLLEEATEAAFRSP